MAQHDMNIANQGFPAFRSDLNDALAALVSNSSGATQPTTMFAHQFWVDTASDPSVLKVRNADNDAWITIGTIDQTNDKFNLTVAGTLSAQGNVSFDGGSLVFNESGADRDARFEGDTDANLLFTDASTDRVGVGTNTPAEKLDVAGTIQASGTVKVAGTSSAGGDIKLYEDTDNGTNYVGFQAPASVTADLLWTLPAADGTADQVLKTDGAGALGWATAGGGGGGGANAQVFTSSGTFTIPSGVTNVKVTVVGGGGNGGSRTTQGASGGGGGGGVAIKWLTGLTAGNTLDVTVGTVANTSSVASGTETISTISATGGASVANNTATGGAGGSGSGGTINISGGAGGTAVYDTPNAYGFTGCGGGSSGQRGGVHATLSVSPSALTGTGGSGWVGGNGGQGRVPNSAGAGSAATGYGNGGGGSHSSGANTTGGAGTAGIVIFEW